VTVSQRLAKLDKLGIFPVRRRGGQHRNARSGKVTSQTSRRGFDKGALVRHFGFSDVTKPSVIRLVTRLNDPDDHLVTWLNDPGRSFSSVAKHKETLTVKQPKIGKETRTGKTFSKESDVHGERCIAVNTPINAALSSPEKEHEALKGRAVDQKSVEDCLVDTD